MSGMTMPCSARSGPYHGTCVDAWKGSTMTQPPDDLDRRPDDTGPDDAVAPEDQATIAWTPPDPTEAPAPEPREPEWAQTDATPTPATPSDATSPPASPIISASPTVPPDAAAPSAAAATPLVGWEAPPPASAAP